MTLTEKKSIPRRNDPCPCGSGKKYKACCGSLSGPVTTSTATATDIKEGFLLYNNNDITGALSCARKNIELNPELAEAHVLEGMCYFARQENSKARDCFLRAEQLAGKLQNSADLSSIKLSLATIEQALENFTGAEQYARQAIEHGMNSAAAYNSLGAALAAQGKLKESIEVFDQAVQLEPGNFQSWLNLASSHFHLNQLMEAGNAYQHVLGLRTNLPEANNGLGAVFLAQSRFNQAAECFRRAIDQGGLDAGRAGNLGAALLYAGKLDEAKSWLEKSIELDPSRVKSYVALGQLLSEKGMQEESQQKFDQALELEPSNESLLYTIASTLEQLNRREEARALLDRIDRLNLDENNPSAIRAQILMGSLLFRQQKTDDARSILESIEPQVEKTPGTYFRFYFEKGYQLDKAGQFNSAFEAFQKGNSEKKQVRELEFSVEEFRNLTNRFRQTYSQNLVETISSMAPDANEGPQPIFIVGFPRSGTTLLEQILGSHSQITAGGELIALKETQAGIGKQLGITGGYDAVLDGLANISSEQVAQIRGNYVGLAMQQINIDLDKKWFTDKMPENLLSLGFISSFFPRSPIIHIRRHPLSSCLSAFMTDFTQGHEYSLDIVDTAKCYLEQMNLVEYYKQNLKMNYLEIFYEELVNHTETVVKQVLEFIGENWEPSCLEFYKSRRTARTASYEQVTRNIYSDSLMRHKNYEKQLFEAARVLHDLVGGYEQRLLSG